jgi:predicted DCC family thiol-disulfide oxidoreductase YuxK
MASVVLFDGVCGLCNRSVDFIIRHDPERRFLFAPLQSEKGRALLVDCGLPEGSLGTIVLVEAARCHVRSTAALRIVRRLEWPWPMLAWLAIVPRPLRDAAYDWLANRRYRWFGETDTCRAPTPEVRERFLS